MPPHAKVCHPTIGFLVQPEETDRRKTDRRDAAKLSEQLWLFRDRIAAGKLIDKLKIVSIPNSIQLQQRRLTNLRKDARASSDSNGHGRLPTTLA